MKEGPYVLSIDGSTDTGVQKMNPLTVCIFDSDRGVVTTQFLDMCMSSSTAEGIFSKMQEERCTNSIKTRVLSVNAAVSIFGCPCHTVHKEELNLYGDDPD